MGARQPIINEINITPLTDIFLVLLIIMMVVAPMLDYPGLNLSVPSMGADADTTEEPKTVNVIITQSDAFFINGEEVELTQITGLVRKFAKDKPDGVVIQANPEASHNAMTQVMDAAQRAGITKMAVVSYEGDSGGE